MCVCVCVCGIITHTHTHTHTQQHMNSCYVNLAQNFMCFVFLHVAMGKLNILYLYIGLVVFVIYPSKKHLPVDDHKR